MNNKPLSIKAVLFDFDGTLTEPGALNFSLLKETIGCPENSPILEFIENLPTFEQQRKNFSILERFEKNAAMVSKPNSGAEDLIQFLHSKRLHVGIITRNSLKSVEQALHNFKHIQMPEFDVIITRETPVEPKPSGAGIKLAAQQMGVDVENILMVGDFVFDIEAGKAAGCKTAFLDYKTLPKPLPVESDFTVSSLDEIKHIVRMGLPLSMGKLPNDILEEFLERLNFQDPSVLINARVGEDTAAMNVETAEVLVLKSDPITFVTDSVGLYAVIINANDIATSGADPRWLLTTLLFPIGSTASGVWQVMHELASVCRQWKISLCGGHTEITDAVTRPVVIGMLAGTVTKRNLIDKRSIQQGDQVLLTKAVAVEGTAIIAKEFKDQLIGLGVSESEIDVCGRFLTDISILEEANIARSFDGVHGMHDVTEGGLATALEELSLAGGHKIRVHVETIPVFPQTEKICRLLDINPIGLIGSGSLLICCSRDTTEGLMARIKEAGIDVTCIGEVLKAGRGIEALDQDSPAEWPRFEVDEISRLF
ncbi:MAG: HAD-IA family hydrolase [Desulfobacterales bacterium]|nr:MAG: HAD-IA family hydrolase [Desulfobacterales bacterium]